MARKTVTTKAEDHGTFVVTHEQKVKAWMQIVVSLILLIAGIMILTSPNVLFPQAIDEGTKRFAAGWIGAVIGYWLS